MSPQDYIDAAHAYFGANITREPSQLEVPTLVLWEQLNSKTPKWLSEHIAAGVPGAELKEIPPCRTSIQCRKPTEFNELLTNFLAQHARQPAGAKPAGRQRDG